METVKIVGISLGVALLLGLIIGKIVGNYLQKRAESGGKSVLSWKEKLVCLFSVLVGAGFILAAVLTSSVVQPETGQDFPPGAMGFEEPQGDVAPDYAGGGEVAVNDSGPVVMEVR